MSEEAILTANGVNGQIEVYRDILRIKRKGFLAFAGHGFKGDKDIQISQIASIQLKKPGLWSNGFIQFVFAGSIESRGGIMDATRDENSVLFTPKQFPSFEAARDTIQRRMSECSQAVSPSPASGLADLETLAELRDKGIITADEFEAKKKQVLGL